MDFLGKLIILPTPIVPPAPLKKWRGPQPDSIGAVEAGILVERTVTEGYTVAIRRKRTAIYYFRFNGIPEEALPCIINGAINMESKEYKAEVQEVRAHAKDIQTKTIGNQGETWYIKYVSSVVTTSDYKKHIGNLRLLERKVEIPPLEGETEEAKQYRLRFLGSVQGCYSQHKEKWVESLRKAEEGATTKLQMQLGTNASDMERVSEYRREVTKLKCMWLVFYFA